MLVYWIWFAELHISDRLKLRLLSHFGNPQAVYEAADYPIDGITDKQLGRIREKSLTRAEEILSDCRRQRIGILTYGHERFPASLKHLEDPPMVLYFRGKLPNLQDILTVGVVGTRRCTEDGLAAAWEVGRMLGSSGAIVISGAAAGIDAAAMEGALPNPVIGVLGCGVDVVYPKENAELYERAAECGCLVSEYPPGTNPNRKTFPRRNRILSGLSRGVLVVEAPEKSGALITARYAMEQGRDVFALLGSSRNAACVGSNTLVKEGAIPVTSARDLLEEYAGRFTLTMVPREEAALQITAKKREESPKPKQTVKKANEKSIDKELHPLYIEWNKADLTEAERQIASLLSGGPLHRDMLVQQSGLGIGAMLSAATTLEMKGILRRLPGGYYGLRERRKES